MPARETPHPKPRRDFSPRLRPDVNAGAILTKPAKADYGAVIAFLTEHYINSLQKPGGWAIIPFAWGA